MKELFVRINAELFQTNRVNDRPISQSTVEEQDMNEDDEFSQAFNEST